jgi:hypothetical protein
MKRLLLVGVALFAAAAITAVVVRSGVATSAAKAASPGDWLSAYVVLTNRGPLTPCQAAPCTAASLTWEYVHVVNSNPVGNDVNGLRRTTVPNAFVLDSVDETILVNGAVFSQDAYSAPQREQARPLRPLAGDGYLR